MKPDIIMPRHVSLIMDGNGRWAKQRGKERVYGHYEGVASVRAVVEACVEWEIPYVSFYAFSEENWNRPQAEVDALMELMGKAMLAEVDNFMKNGVRFMVLGNRERLSEDLKADIDKVMGITKENTGTTMILFLSYSGRWDILQASKRMAYDLINNPKASVDSEFFSHYLVTDGIPDPDLLIRSSGEERISNYLLWQLAYTEFVFTDTLWPDFRKEQFADALRQYSSRDRRFGKVK